MLLLNNKVLYARQHHYNNSRMPQSSITTCDRAENASWKQACVRQAGPHLGGDAAQGSQHGPASMQHLNLPVPLEGFGVC